jgi:hypothetical protein
MRERMRTLAVWLLMGTPAFAQADDDDPKAAPQIVQAAPPPAQQVAPPAQPVATPVQVNEALADSDAGHAVVHDEDDPKGARAPALHKRRSWSITRPVPRVKLAYRNFTTIGLEKNTDLPFHIIELDYYPSSGYFRFGLDTELGLNNGPYSAWYLTTGAAVGFQYPARVTPFLEGRFVAGLMGGSAMGATAVSYTYMGGLETGAEIYVGGRFYFSAAIGWVHPVYSGVDIDWVKAHPGLAPARKDFAADAFTFKVGLGL